MRSIQPTPKEALTPNHKSPPRALSRATLRFARLNARYRRRQTGLSQPFYINQTGTLLPRHLAHFVSAIDIHAKKIGDTAFELHRMGCVADQGWRTRAMNSITFERLTSD